MDNELCDHLVVDNEYYHLVVKLENHLLPHKLDVHLVALIGICPWCL